MPTRKKVYIMRGLPGSGKSTRAHKLAGQHGAIHSTDEFFYQNGIYVYDPDKLEYYHHLNLWGFEESVMRDVPTVICDNVNGQRWQYTKYVHLAVEYGYKVEVVRMPHLPLETLMRRNVHNVPLHIIVRMYETWQN